MSRITSHGWKVPDMAIFTPVQTTMMAASPVQSCCPLFSSIRPAGTDDRVQHTADETLHVVELPWGDIGRDARINLDLHCLSLLPVDRAGALLVISLLSRRDAALPTNSLRRRPEP